MKIIFNLSGLMDNYNAQLKPGESRLNQAQIAKQTGLAATTVFRVFNNQTSQVSLMTIERLCEVFDCDPGDLFRRIE